MMASSPHSTYPPELAENLGDYLIELLKDFSFANGLLQKPPVTNPNVGYIEGAISAPVTLFPSLMPSSCVEEARNIQVLYNKLYAAMARDEAWLRPIIEELAETDDFVKRLWEIHKKIKIEGYVQNLTLGLFRSDYMIHTERESSKPELRQVEFNTIASSFGGLSSQVSKLHKYLLGADAYPESVKPFVVDSSLLESDAAESLAAGLASAHETYAKTRTSNSPLCVIFVVQEPERNIFDQRHIEQALILKHHIPTFRVPWKRITSLLKVDSNRKLHYKAVHRDQAQEFEVSTIYFRAGYSPDEYDEQAWEARYQLEKSQAIKCPSVLTQLTGCKKIQQVLASPDGKHLSRFVDQAEARRLRRTFAAMHPMDLTEPGQEARKIALDPKKARGYVLKPQREGGGNNIYREAIPDFLNTLSPSRFPAYILMEMIEPPAQRNVILRGGQLKKGEVICELGIYGVCLWNGHDQGPIQLVENRLAGYLLRTKARESSEGGVAAGFGALDSICMVPDEFFLAN